MGFTSLHEKLDYEWNVFVLDKLRTSRENIFSSSEEIETKKLLFCHLKKLPVLDARTQEAMLKKQNLLDSAYLFISRGAKKFSDTQEALEHWIHTSLL